MKALVLENRDMRFYQDGSEITDFEYLALTFKLVHTKLIKQEIDFELGGYTLVFDLDRHQDFPNFATEGNVV